MSYDPNNPERFELLDAALRRDVPPEEPLSSELHAMIVASIRAESGGRGRVLTFRRYVIGAAALAAGVLLAITLVVASRLTVKAPLPADMKYALASSTAWETKRWTCVSRKSASSRP